MLNPAHTTFAAIFRAEVLLNTRRVAPYVMLALFSGNAWLWTVKGASVHYGWAINCDYSILRNLAGFQFLTLPLFTALIMADPIGRDFRTGIYPFIFSKPVRKGTYLAAKFFGNFAVLVGCISAFSLTMIVLQAFPSEKMLVQPFRVWAFFKHLFFFVVISHLLLASISFTVGTLTRNPKIVYGLTVVLYPLYIIYQLQFLKRLPNYWRYVLDPLSMNAAGDRVKSADSVSGYISADLINHMVFDYDSLAIANRVFVVLASLLILAILYFRFSMVERGGSAPVSSAVTTIGFGTVSEWLVPAESGADAETNNAIAVRPLNPVDIPTVALMTEGSASNLRRWSAALAIELRLLKIERGLLVILPIAILLCVVTFITFPPPDGPLQTATYALRTAEMSLLFLVAIAVMFIGESMHRDRELRIEPLLWTVPAPNWIFLLSKFTATVLLSLGFSALVSVAAVVLQIWRGRSPFDVFVYPKVFALILVPTVIVLVSAALMLNVVLREKYVAYAVSFALAIGLFYLFGQGYKHWSYNFVLYEIWTPSDLAGPGLKRLVILRLYALAIAGICLVAAHLCFQRKTKGSSD